MRALLFFIKKVICGTLGVVGTFSIGFALQWMTKAPLFASHGRWARQNPKHTAAEGWIHFLGLCARVIESYRVERKEVCEISGHEDCGLLCCDYSENRE